jgi:hypothetical protein
MAGLGLRSSLANQPLTRPLPSIVMSTSDSAAVWTSHLDLISSARAMRRFASIERGLFAVIGQWVRSEIDTAAKLQFAQQCYHHHWHAELLTTLLPTPAEHYPTAYEDDIVHAGRRVDALDHLATKRDTTGRLDQLAGVVLPELIAEYRRHLDRTVPHTDGPTIRVLGLILNDIETDLRIAQQLRATPAGAPRV